jgi:hypothetical protein
MEDVTVKRFGLLLTVQSQLDAIKLENERWRMSGLVPKYNEKDITKYTDLLAEVVHASNYEIEKIAFEIKEKLSELDAREIR